MDEVGLFGVDRKYPNELSAGQSKSAALARAIIMDPVVLFADEPTAGVDPYTEACIANLLNYLRETKRMAIVMACNAVETIRALKSRFRVLEEGVLVDSAQAATGAEGLRPLIKIYQESL